MREGDEITIREYLEQLLDTRDRLCDVRMKALMERFEDKVQAGVSLEKKITELALEVSAVRALQNRSQGSGLGKQELWTSFLAVLALLVALGAIVLRLL
jgi:hypothetical protein